MACGAAAAEEPFGLECEVLRPAGARREPIRTVAVRMPAGTPAAARPLGEGVTVVELEARDLPGIRPGTAPCAAARVVQVMPGRMLGLPMSRIVITASGGRPAVVTESDHVRLLWVPARDAAPFATTPVSGDPARDGRVAQIEEENARRREDLARREAEAPRRRERAAEAAPPRPREPTAVEPAPPAAVREGTARKRRAEPPASPSPAAAPPGEGTGRAGRTAAPPPAEGEPRPAVPAPVPAPARPGPPPAAAGAPVSPPPDFVPAERPHAATAVIATEVRSGPGRRYKVVRQVASGTVLMVDGRAGDWLRAGSDGWVFGAYLTSGDGLAAPGTRRTVVEAVTAPVYSGPGGQYEVVAELFRGQDVVVDDVQAEWAHVRGSGWVRRGVLGRLDVGTPDGTGRR
jgi:uncharacterized protein YraI